MAREICIKTRQGEIPHILRLFLKYLQKIKLYEILCKTCQRYKHRITIIRNIDKVFSQLRAHKIILRQLQVRDDLGQTNGCQHEHEKIEADVLNINFAL